MVIGEVKVQRVEMIDHTKVSLADLAAGAVDVPNRIVNFLTGQSLLLAKRKTLDRQRTSYFCARVSINKSTMNLVSDRNSRAKYIFGM